MRCLQGSVLQFLQCFFPIELPSSNNLTLYMRRQVLPLCMAAKVSALGLTLSSSPYLRSEREQFSFKLVCFAPSPDPMACGQFLCSTPLPGQYIHENTFFPHMYQCNKLLFLHMDPSNAYFPAHGSKQLDSFPAHGSKMSFFS